MQHRREEPAILVKAFTTQNLICDLFLEPSIFDPVGDTAFFSRFPLLFFPIFLPFQPRWLNWRVFFFNPNSKKNPLFSLHHTTPFNQPPSGHTTMLLFSVSTQPRVILCMHFFPHNRAKKKMSFLFFSFGAPEGNFKSANKKCPLFLFAGGRKNHTHTPDRKLHHTLSSSVEKRSASTRTCQRSKTGPTYVTEAREILLILWPGRRLGACARKSHRNAILCPGKMFFERGKLWTPP